MKLIREFSRVFLLSLALSLIFAARSELKEPENDEKVLHRQKRFLIFPGGGTAKFVGESLKKMTDEVKFNQPFQRFSGIFGTNRHCKVHQL